MKAEKKFTWRKFWQLIWPVLLFILYAFCQILSLHSAILAIILTIIIGYFTLRYHKTTPRKLQHPVRSSMLLVTGSIILIFLLNMCYQLVLNQFHIQIPVGDNQQILNQLGRKNITALFYLTVLIGPVFEESIFRLGFISFKNKNWTIISSILSAIFFALAHVSGTWNTWVFGEYLIISTVFTLVYLYMRDLRYSLMVHVIYNSLVFLVILSML